MSFRALPFNIESWRARWSARRGVLLPLLLCGISSIVLFHGLGDGSLSVFDEGLHGTLARRMLAAGKYLALVDSNGQYSMDTGFSKPPLLLWLTALSLHVFDASLFSLRFPVAVAMLGTVMLCVVIARSLIEDRARADVSGFVWGTLLVTTTGSLELARTSNIEVLFTFFAMAALTLFMATRRSPHIRVLPLFAASAMLALAFLTKQIVVLIPLFAIAVVEVASLRHDRWRAVLRGLVPVLIVLVVGAAWALLAWQAMGDELIDTLWRFTVKDRVAGFGGDRHFRWLNRIADNLDTLTSPLPWPLGVFGLFHLATVRQMARSDGRVDESFVLPAYLASTTLVFENVSRSTLLWYVFSMIPVLALGIAHLVANALDLLSRPDRPNASPIAGGLGIAALVLTLDGSLARVMSRLDALIMASLVVTGTLVLSRARGRVFSPRLPAGLVVTALTVVVVLGALRHPSHRSGPAVEESLMARAGRFGEVPVSVDERLLTRASAKDLHLGTYFGAHARQGPPPWRDAPAGKESRARVRVDLVSWPEELSPRAGVTLLRGPGGVVLEGALDSPPYSDADVEDLLARGALTFEAEHGVSTLPGSLVRRSGASGGALRGLRPRQDEKPPGGVLTSGPWFRMPAGDYEAVFDVSYRCGGFAWEEKIGTVEVRAEGKKLRSKTIKCKPDAEDRERTSTMVVPFELGAPGHVDLVVLYSRGVLAHDRTQVRRRAPKAVPAPSANAPP